MTPDPGPVDVPDLPPRRDRRLYVYLTSAERMALGRVAEEWETSDSSLARSFILRGLNALIDTKEIKK